MYILGKILTFLRNEFFHPSFYDRMRILNVYNEYLDLLINELEMLVIQSSYI